MEAIVRPAGWELPLFLHVAGAMLLVGSLVVVLALTATAARSGEGAAQLTRLGFRVLLVAVLPSFVAMRVGAQWVEAEADWGEPSWIGIGYATSDGGLLLIVVATVLAWRATRRGTATRAVAALSGVLLLLFTVTIWAMTTKPG